MKKAKASNQEMVAKWQLAEDKLQVAEKRVEEATAAPNAEAETVDTIWVEKVTKVRQNEEEAKIICTFYTTEDENAEAVSGAIYVPISESRLLRRIGVKKADA